MEFVGCVWFVDTHSVCVFHHQNYASYLPGHCTQTGDPTHAQITTVIQGFSSVGQLHVNE